MIEGGPGTDVPAYGDMYCFQGGGPGSNCLRCICADALTGQFLFYCSPCLD